MKGLDAVLSVEKSVDQGWEGGELYVWLSDWYWFPVRVVIGDTPGKTVSCSRTKGVYRIFEYN